MAFARAVKGIPQVSGAAFLHVKVTVGGCIRLISRGSPPNVVQQIVRGIKQFPISAKIIVALRKPMPRIDVIKAFNFSTKCSICPSISDISTSSSRISWIVCCGSRDLAMEFLALHRHISFVTVVGHRFKKCFQPCQMDQ